MLLWRLHVDYLIASSGTSRTLLKIMNTAFAFLLPTHPLPLKYRRGA